MTVEAYAPPALALIQNTGPFAFGHYLRAAEDLDVLVVDGDRVFALGALDYTVALNGSQPGGTIMLSATAFAANAGRKLRIDRSTRIEQGWVGKTAREVGLERQLDWGVAAVQELREKLDRALVIGRGSGPADELPGDPGRRAQQVLAFDANGDPVMRSVESFSVTALPPSAVAKREYASVAQMLVDPTIGYALGGMVTVAIAPGEFLQAGPWWYLVAPSNVTDAWNAQGNGNTTVTGLRLYPIGITSGGNHAGAFDARADNAVDDAPAIQQAMNMTAAAARRDVRLAPGRHRLDAPLLPFYDAARNPGYPTADNRQGRIALRGTGQVGEQGAVRNGLEAGTVLRSTVDDAPALDLRLGGAPWRLRDVSLEQFTVRQNWPGPVIAGDGATSQTMVTDVTVKVEHVDGDGAEFLNLWISWFDRFNIYGHEDGSAVGDGTGTGLVIRNRDLAGGLIELSRSTATDFLAAGGVGMRIGSRVGETTALITNVLLRSNQTIDNETGLEIGRSVRALLVLNHHDESAGATGIKAYGNAAALTFIAGNHSNGPAGGAHYQIGDASLDGADRQVRAVNILGDCFVGLPAGTTAIRISHPPDGLIIGGCNFEGAGIGVDFGPSTLASGIVYLGNNNGAATPIAGVWQKVELLQEPGLVYIGGALCRRSGENVAAAANLQLDRTDFVRLTGAANVDGVSVPIRGSRQITLMGASPGTAATLRNGQAVGAGIGALRLAGAADFTLGHRDTVTLVYDEPTGEWWEMCRSEN